MMTDSGTRTDEDEYPRGRSAQGFRVRIFEEMPWNLCFDWLPMDVEMSW